MQNKITIGKIVGSHGIKGYVKVMYLTDFPERINALKSIIIDEAEYKLESRSNFKNMWLLKLEGIDSRDDAEKLRNKKVEIFKEDRMPLAKGTYYIDDIIGLKVLDETGAVIGYITDVLKTGANDVYVIELYPGSENQPNEILFPALKHLVKEISISEKEMIVEIPDGLY